MIILKRYQKIALAYEASSFFLADHQHECRVLWHSIQFWFAANGDQSLIHFFACQAGAIAPVKPGRTDDGTVDTTADRRPER